MTAPEPGSRLLGTLLSRVFPAEPRLVERVEEGVSTWVYRVVFGQATFYLRILPELGASLAPEVAVHNSLRTMQVHVPEVIYFEHCYEPLQRSVMIVTEVPGIPLSRSTGLEPDALARILEDAGRDLACINSIPVEGFGWVKRGGDHAPVPHELQAEVPTYRAIVLESWEVDVAYLAAHVLLPQDVALLEEIVARYDSWFDSEDNVLAHGDFDATAIYQADGRYSGIIDFGEIRGANQWYDLGHCHMRDGEYLPTRLLPDLLLGYREVISIPANVEQRILFISVLINVRALARSLRKRPPNRFTRHQLEVLRADLAALSS